MKLERYTSLVKIPEKETTEIVSFGSDCRLSKHSVSAVCFVGSEGFLFERTVGRSVDQPSWTKSVVSDTT